MKNFQVKKLVFASMLAALTCVATIAIRVPSPTNGYVNLGDCVVLLSAWTIGGFYGTLAAGIGSMLADIITGYAHYAIATFIIKSLVALTAYYLYKTFDKTFSGKTIISRILSGSIAETIMVLGYFLFSSLLLGKGLAAAASIPGNIVQAVFGVFAATLLVTALSKAIKF